MRRIGPIQNLVPPDTHRRQTLGDDALKVGVNRRPVQRPAFTDNCVGEHDPALARSPTRARIASRCLRQRSQINAVDDQRVEGHVGRAAAAKERLVELRASSVVARRDPSVGDQAPPRTAASSCARATSHERYQQRRGIDRT
jgi:hypothetical protein